MGGPTLEQDVTAVDTEGSWQVDISVSKALCSTLKVFKQGSRDPQTSPVVTWSTQSELRHVAMGCGAIVMASTTELFAFQISPWKQLLEPIALPASSANLHLSSTGLVLVVLRNGDLHLYDLRSKRRVLETTIRHCRPRQVHSLVVSAEQPALQLHD